MRKFSTTLAVVGLLNPSGAFSLGVGDIRLHSFLNENLNAEIPLVLSQESLPSLKVKLAPREDFAKMGLERPAFLTKLRFEPVQKADGSYAIKVGSTDSVREPFLNFLVELNWPQGRAIREFTVLLDPPNIVQKPDLALASLVEPTATVPPESSAEKFPSAQPPTKPTPAASVAQTARGVAVTTPGENAISGSEYGPVRRNEMLSRIAKRLNRDPAITNEQMTMALFRYNPHAFSKPNVNALEVGVILRIPDREYITSLSPSSAREEYYRHQSIHAGLPVSPPAIPSESTTAKNESALPVVPKPASSDARESIAGATAAPHKGAEGAAKTPGSVSTRLTDKLQRETEELRNLLVQMEQRIENLRKSELLRSEAALADSPSPPTTQPGQVAGSNERTGVNRPESQSDGVTERTTAAPAVPAPATTPTPESGTVTAKVSGPGTQGSPSVERKEPMTKPVWPANKKVPPPRATRVERGESANAGSERSDFLGKPAYWGAADALVLAGALALFKFRKRWLPTRKATGETIPFELDQDRVPAVPATAVLASNVPTPDYASCPPDGSSSARENLTPVSAPDRDTDEMDPIFEADIFLAYGRDKQALESMRNAVRQQPERQDYWLKLLEILFAASDKGAFGNYADEWQQRGQPIDSQIWNKVEEMGQKLCPEHPLFQVSSGTTVYTAQRVQAGHDELDHNDQLIENLKRFSIEGQDPAHSSSLRQDTGDALLLADDSLRDSAPSFGSLDLSEFSLPSTASLDSAFGGQPKVGPREFGLFEEEDSTRLTRAATQDDERLVAPFLTNDFDPCRVDMASAEALLTPDSLPMFPVDTPQSEAETVSWSLNQEDDDDSGFGDSLELVEELDNLETKLDLAKAYADMDDHELAREILQEILEKGTEEQKREARSLLSKVA